MQHGLACFFNVQVRKMAYQALAERMPLSKMRTEDAALLLRRGLTDRTGTVRDAVAKNIVKAWLEEHGGEPVPLLQALGVQAHPGEVHGLGLLGAFFQEFSSQWRSALLQASLGLSGSSARLQAE